MTTKELSDDLERILKLNPPVKRAAYSDRIAWLMAIFSELAYTRFDEENQDSLMSLATELAAMTDEKSIAQKLRTLSSLVPTEADAGNKILRSVLAIGEFELKCVLNNSGTDTQGFIAVRKSDDGTGMVVLSFRGTQQIKDWMTNLRVDKIPIKKTDRSGTTTVGNVHKGFHKAFESVERQIQDCLNNCGDLPIYITGHSLGGALAVLATWFISGEKLAACYTFGAPRVGDEKLMNRFYTPIYRIVNGADPVPFVPPSGKIIGPLKAIVRAIGVVITPMDVLTNMLVKSQGYRHYGFQRYLSICEKGISGTYPGLRNEYGIGSVERLWRYVGRLVRGEIKEQKRIDKYHDISIYRDKLRAFAIKRQNQK